MSDLAERIRVAAKRITAMSPSRERRAEASDLGYVVINNAQTILAGLAAIEALDQAVAILKCASNVMLPPESNRQINNVIAQLRKINAALQSKDAKP